MTAYVARQSRAAASSARACRRRLAVVALLALIPALYLLTLAQGLVLGDPTEYTFVAHVLGIAHPPGYAFITLAGKLFQTLIPIGSIPWRMHLLSATAATVAALAVFGAARAIGRGRRAPWLLPALFAAFTVATAANFWQHAIHANPHVITAAFLATNLLLLTTWSEGRGRAARLALPAFAFSAGLGLTHHPLTALSLPAYGLFILWRRPDLWRDGRLLLRLAAAFLLGLSVWLYFPIRSPMQPLFGPHDMNTLEGFSRVVLAEGLRVNLFNFGPADQPDRALVFWTLLRLQYSLPVIFLALIGLASLLRPRLPGGPMAWLPSPLLLLYGGAFLLNYAFVINTVQDVMAYLLGPFLIVGLLAGIGLLALLEAIRRRPAARPLSAAMAALFILVGPTLQVARNLPRVSLRDYNEGQTHVEAVFAWFDGRDEAAVLLNDWERMTPLWYSRFVEDRWPDPADVRPEFVSTARPWLPLVFDYLPGQPVYLSSYRPEVVAVGFRLRPRGPFFQVVEPGDQALPPELEPLPRPAVAGALELLAYDLPRPAATAGDLVPLTLAMRAPQGTADYYVPVIRLGHLSFPFTTDSHLITPLWQPGEVIVERFDFALPHDLPAGRYPVRLSFQNLSQPHDPGLDLALGQLAVTAQTRPVAAGRLLANFGQRVCLVSTIARTGWQRRAAPWSQPLAARPGDTIHLTLEWQALAPADQSYTVFVHLIDLSDRPVVFLDYTPLGGAAPTHLWIPKWLTGQRLLDPYPLTIPAGLPPGDYLVEVGLYEMTSGRRLHMADAAGNLVGDRYILGGVTVATP